LTRDPARFQNQIESLLEEAHIKLSSLVSDLLGGWRTFAFFAKVGANAACSARFQPPGRSRRSQRKGHTFAQSNIGYEPT
jgi:hypothetical protein